MKASGAPGIFEGNPYEMHANQKHQLGAKMFAANGDIYRYTYAGATGGTDFVAGNLYVALANEDNHLNQATGTASAVGSDAVEFAVGATAVDANEYDGGQMFFVDVSPEGEWYEILSHDTSAGSTTITVNISPALKTAVGATSEASLIRNAWNKPAISQLVTESAAGVALQDWDLSVGEQYGWLKTRGLAAVLGDNTGVTDGQECVISNELNGAVGAKTTVAEICIAQAVDASASGEFHPAYLLID